MAVKLAWLTMIVACGSRTDLSSTPLVVDASTSSDGAGTDSAHPDANVECDANERRVLAPVIEGPGQIAASIDGYVYWAESYAIRRVRKTGGTPETFGVPSVASNDLLDVFALDSSFVYFATDSIVRVPKTGGAEEPLGLHEGNALVALGGSSLYVWKELSPVLERISTTGGAPTVVASSIPADTNALLVEGNMAFGASAQIGTFAVDIDNGNVKTLDSTEAVNLVADETYLYFTTGKHGPNGSNAIMRVPKIGGAAQQVVNAAYAFAMFLDGDVLYFSDRLTGQILRVNKNGGPASVFEMALAEETKDIAVDDKCVYWTSNLVGGVFVAPK